MTDYTLSDLSFKIVIFSMIVIAGVLLFTEMAGPYNAPMSDQMSSLNSTVQQMFNKTENLYSSKFQPAIQTNSTNTDILSQIGGAVAGAFNLVWAISNMLWTTSQFVWQIPEFMISMISAIAGWLGIPTIFVGGIMAILVIFIAWKLIELIMKVRT